MISRSIISDRILAMVVCIVLYTSLATYAQNVTLQSGNFFDPKVWSKGLPNKDQTLIIMPGHMLNLNRQGEVFDLIISYGATLNLGTRNLSIIGTFTNHGTLNTGIGTIIFNGGGNQTLNLSVAQEINSITITNNSNVEITNASVNLTGVLNIQSGSLITNNKLTLVSSASKTAQLATLGTTASIVGNITVQQYIYSNLRLWRYLSSPVKNATVADWQNEIPVTGTFENPSTGSGIVAKSPSLYFYDETPAGASSLGYVKYPDVVNSSNALLQPGRGYSIFVRDNAGRPTILDVTGIPNTGDQIIPVTYTESDGITEDGWNLIGNPYPSSISWDSVDIESRVGLSNAIYYSDNSSGSLIMRSYVNGIGTPAGTTGVIHSSQAFWVKSITANPQLIIREDDKVNDITSFFRTEANKVSDIIRIRLADSKGKSDEAVIRMHEDASGFFDVNLDAVKYPQSTLSLSTRGKDLYHYCINSIAYTKDTAQEVKIYIGKSTEGNHTMTFFDFQNMDTSIHITLVDKYLNNETNVRANQVYSFLINTDTFSFKDRFSLRFIQNAKQTEGNLITDIQQENNVKKINIYPNPTLGGEINIQAKFGVANIRILDVTGKEVRPVIVNGGIEKNNCLVLVKELPKGIHLIVVEANSGEKFIEKLVIK